MRYLVDTHILIWWISNDSKLKKSVKEILKDPSNQIYVSVVSGVEIALKVRIGKLKLNVSLKECFEKSGFEELEVNLSHAIELAKLPIHHKDPFDRILISQCRVEKLTLITKDEKIRKYKVKIIQA